MRVFFEPFIQMALYLVIIFTRFRVYKILATFTPMMQVFIPFFPYRFKVPAPFSRFRLQSGQMPFLKILTPNISMSHLIALVDIMVSIPTPRTSCAHRHRYIRILLRIDCEFRIERKNICVLDLFEFRLFLRKISERIFVSI